MLFNKDHLTVQNMYPFIERIVFDWLWISYDSHQITETVGDDKKSTRKCFLCYSVVGDCHLHLILIPGTLESNEGAHGAERQAIHWQAGAFWPNPIGLWRAVEMAMRPVLVECGAVPNQ